jgi:hypothetical protein
MDIRSAAGAVFGGALLLLGIVLVPLPGPGLVLVVAGLALLARVFPRLERHVEPVRRRAMQAAQASVSSPWRLGGSVLAGAALVGAGLVWGLVPGLPYGGWAVGSSVIVSGTALLVLLAYSHRDMPGGPPGTRGSGAGGTTAERDEERTAPERAGRRGNGRR